MTPSRTGLAAALLLASLLAPMPASAAGDSATQGVDYQIWMAPTPGQVVVIASVSVPGSVELPATVRIPIPLGMTVKWSGEISGGDASTDVKRPHQVRQGRGGQYAEFQVRQYRRAQIDVVGKEFPPDASSVSEQFDFVQSVPSGESGFSVRVPPGVRDVGIDPAPQRTPEPGTTGEWLYSLPSIQLKPGESTRVSITYRAAPQTSSSTDGGARPRWILILIAAASALIIGVMVLLVRGGRQRG
jgi:hypothetical protein